MSKSVCSVSSYTNCCFLLNHRSTNFVNKDGIVITTTTNTAAGLRIVLYAELINGGGVLTKDALEKAIQVD